MWARGIRGTQTLYYYTHYIIHDFHRWDVLWLKCFLPCQHYQCKNKKWLEKNNYQYALGYEYSTIFNGMPSCILVLKYDYLTVLSTQAIIDYTFYTRANNNYRVPLIGRFICCNVHLWSRRLHWIWRGDIT